MLGYDPSRPGRYGTPGSLREGIDLKFNLMSLGDHITDPLTGHRPTAQQRHRAFVDMAVRGEHAGFNRGNMGGHHGIGYIYSPPPVGVAPIAPRNSRARPGAGGPPAAQPGAPRGA